MVLDFAHPYLSMVLVFAHPGFWLEIRGVCVFSLLCERERELYAVAGDADVYTCLLTHLLICKSVCSLQSNAIACVQGANL